MTRTRLYLLGLLAAAAAVTVAAMAFGGRTQAASAQPAIAEAEDDLTMQAELRYRQCQPHHWRYVMLRQ